MSLTVEPFNATVLGNYPTTGNLIRQFLPGGSNISVADFQANRASGVLRFGARPLATCRIGVFKATANGETRIVILVLPESGVADNIVLFVTQSFGQAAAGLAWLKPTDPFSLPYIREMMLKHVINRYGPQTIAGRPNTGLFYVLRVLGAREMGPFENNGAVWRDCLDQLQTLTEDAFTLDAVTVATYSSGILSCNALMPSLGRAFTIDKVINIDPAGARSINAPEGVAKRQFLSGQTGAPRPGFDYLPLPRWEHEAKRRMLGTSIEVHDWARMKKIEIGQFSYLHNIAMPEHMLFLGLKL